MNLPLFHTDNTPVSYTAVVIDPDGVGCMRKNVSDLYTAKLWITEKIYTNKEKNTGKQFPFGFDYCIFGAGDVIMSPEEINLPERTHA